MRRAYSYIRFSSKRQAKGFSLARQTDPKVKALCDKHGWTLDPVTYEDLGLSGFRGENARTGDLAVFLEGIRPGKIERGSVLVVEALDRLTRADIDEALELFMGIIRKGVDIATLDPERIYTLADMKQQPMNLFEPLIIMARGNEESRRKHNFSHDNWTRKIAAAKSKPITGNIPGWLALDDKGKFHQSPERVKSVRMLFDLAVDGHGDIAITKTMNAKQMPTIGKSPMWDQSTVRRILRSRQVLGEYQPMTRVGKWGRKPHGPPVVGYYPAIVTEAKWCKAQQCLDARVRAGGAVSDEGPANLFTGLVVYTDGSSMVTKHLSSNRPRHMVSALAFKKNHSDYLTFRYKAFEDCVLYGLDELTREDIQPKPADDHETEMQAAEGRLADLDWRIAKVAARIENDDNLDVLLDQVAKMRRERLEAAKELESLKAQQHDGGRLEAWQDIRRISKLIEKAHGDELAAMRRRLKQRIAELVETIVIRVERDGWFSRTLTGAMRLTSGVERWMRIKYTKSEIKYAVIDDPRTLGTDGKALARFFGKR
jgi:DNA invertase Pin-like site-specific DNA recombinase